MTPTDTIIALEKALEDQLRRLQEFAHDEVSVHVTRGQLRTLLDAHASALQEIEDLRVAREQQHDHAIKAGMQASSALRDAERMREALKRIAAIEDCYSGTDWQEIEEAREIAQAALDDNTKGAAE